MSNPGMPQFYQKKDFKTDKLKEMYGTLPSKRDLRRFNRYMNSEQGQKDWLTHENSESQKYMQSWEDRIAASHAKAKDMMSKAKESPIQHQTTTPIKPVNVETPAEKPEEKPVLTPKSNDHWNAEAVKYGFKDMSDVKNWQAQNGLVADGKFGKNSIAKYNSIAQANQQVAATNNVAQPQVATGSNNSSGITELDFRNNKHFRNIHGAKPNATIDIEGKTYPIMATTGLLGSNSGIENDRVYAFDPETGMVRAVWENFMGMPHKKWANNSTWITPDWMAGPEYDWKKANPMPAMRGPLGGGFTPEYEAWLEKYKAAKAAGFKKQGGTMNRIKYFQQGGAAPQQDIKAQVTALVQAAMQGDQKATQTVNQIMEAAKAGDQQAVQLAQMIQQVAQQIQGQATSAKWGAKLGYIRSLKFAKGGVACPACQSGAAVPTSQDKAYIKSTKKVEEKACGGKAKAKKRYFGGWL